MEIYLLKSVACLALFYAFYKLVLEQQAMHTFKRFYLLGSIVASCVIPFITFTTYIEVAPVAFTQTLQTSEMPLIETTVIETPTNYLPVILWSLYGLGVLLFGSIFFRNLFQILKKIKQNPKEKTLSTYRVLLKIATIPHTFFNYVFLNKTDYQNGDIPQEVLLHEEAHATQKHSIDVLIIELLQVIFWFNPIIWLYKKSIKLNHEFLADCAVLNTGADAYEYSNILLAFSSNASSPVLANSIIHSSTRLTALFSSNAFGQVKKRLTVMKTTSSKRTTLLRSLLLLPLLAILIYGFSTSQEIEKIASPITMSVNPEIQKEYETWYAETIHPIENRAEKQSLKVEISGTAIFVNDKETTLKKFSKAINDVTDNWSKKDFELYRLSIQINNTTEDFKTKVNREYRKTHLFKQASNKSDFLSAPQTPPSPITFDIGKTLDHIIAVAKKDGVFFYRNNQISSDEAIALVKINPEINLHTKNFDSGTPVTTFQDEPLNFDDTSIKIFKLSVDFNTVIINGKVSSIATFKNDVDEATNDWTEKDFKSTQPRTSFTNANEVFLNKLDREFKKTRYSKITGGMSIFWPHFKCKPEHIKNGEGYPIVTKYDTKKYSKEEIITKLENQKGDATTYYINEFRATLKESIKFVKENQTLLLHVITLNAKGKKDVYLDNREGATLNDNIPPPPPAPKVLKGQKSDIPPPPPGPKSNEEKGPNGDETNYNEAATRYFLNSNYSSKVSENNQLPNSSQIKGLVISKTLPKTNSTTRYYYEGRLISLADAGNLLEENQDLRVAVSKDGSTGIVTIVNKSTLPPTPPGTNVLNGGASSPIQKESKTNHTARSMGITILDDGSYVVNGMKTNKQKLLQTVEMFNQDITKDIRKNILNIHVKHQENIPESEIHYIFDALKEYGYYRMVTKNQEIIIPKGNTPFGYST